MRDYYGSYALVAVLFVVGGALVGLGLLANRMLRPDRPTPAKTSSYECGMDPVGEGWAQTHIRYYVYAYLYVVFAADAVFLFPWATVFSSPGYGVVTLVEMFVFLGFLATGIVYAWRRGVMTWF